MTFLFPGDYVVVRTLFCGLCNDEFDGLHIGVLGVSIPDEDAVAHFGPTPHYYVRQLTCPECKESDLHADDGGAIYSRVEITPADDVLAANGMDR